MELQVNNQIPSLTINIAKAHSTQISNTLLDNLLDKQLDTPLDKQHIQNSTQNSIQNATQNTPISWDTMCKQLNNIDGTVITTETLIGAAIYSVSALEVLEQMTSRLDNINPDISARPNKGCYSCGGILRTKDNVMICQKCGLEMQGLVVSTQEDESIITSQNTNVNDKGFISMKIIGKGSYGYNRNLLKNCADYIRYRKMTTLKGLLKL